MKSKSRKKKVVFRVFHVKLLRAWFVTRSDFKPDIPPGSAFITRKAAVTHARMVAVDLWHGRKQPSQVMIHSAKTGRFNVEFSYGCDDPRIKG